jgi:propionyl-CoA carboxylase alpha chain
MTTETSAEGITTLLVANRGEIARRIMRTARAMGISTVAVYSDVDRSSPHVDEADLAVRLPGALPADTYLRSDLLLEAAARTSADALHPGYGFLSESGDFARAVSEAGLIWVGPPADAIDAMGSKIGSKEIMRAAGVPTLPSIVVDDELPSAEAIRGLGWPLLVKASAGGGGRGMRVVPNSGYLVEAVEGARREAAAAFGDGTVFLERYLADPRHIEVQVLADSHGETVALFERECSIQRRHQKIIEEAPSPAVSSELRRRLMEAAVAAARAVGYVNAGTVEFVVDRNGDPFFLEMNTRLQVEHPVSEAVTGLDLVRLQLLLAAGVPMPSEVGDAVAIGPRGHAVEARIYAEDPARDWLPSTGRLHRFEVGSAGSAVRVDSGVESGSVVSPHYDPMLAKVIAHAPTRTEAAAALAGELARARIHGVVTNRDLLVRTLRHPAFVNGLTDTGFLDRHGLDRLAAPLADEAAVARHAVAAALAGQASRRAETRVQRTIPSGFRNNAFRPQQVTYDGGGRTLTVGYRLDRYGREPLSVEIGGEPLVIDAVAVGAGEVALTTGGVTRRYRVDRAGPATFVDGPDGSSALVEHVRFPRPDERVGEGSALAPMPGTVVRVGVAKGGHVNAGQILVVLEAMKMEHTVHAGAAGTVVEVDVSEGDQVETGRLLAVVEPDTTGAEGADENRPTERTGGP